MIDTARRAADTLETNQINRLGVDFSTDGKKPPVLGGVTDSSGDYSPPYLAQVTDPCTINPNLASCRADVMCLKLGGTWSSGSCQFPQPEPNMWTSAKSVVFGPRLKDLYWDYGCKYTVSTNPSTMKAYLSITRLRGEDCSNNGQSYSADLAKGWNPSTEIKFNNAHGRVAYTFTITPTQVRHTALKNNGATRDYSQAW